MERRTRSKEEKALMSQIANAEEKLRDLKQKLKEERIKNARVSVGDIVTDRTGEEFQVTAIAPRSYWTNLVVAKKKKDGSFGKATKTIFDWELVRRHNAGA